MKRPKRKEFISVPTPKIRKKTVKPGHTEKPLPKRKPKYPDDYEALSNRFDWGD